MKKYILLLVIVVSSTIFLSLFFSTKEIKAENEFYCHGYTWRYFEDAPKWVLVPDGYVWYSPEFKFVWSSSRSDKHTNHYYEIYVCFYTGLIPNNPEKPNKIPVYGISEEEYLLLRKDFYSIDRNSFGPSVQYYPTIGMLVKYAWISLGQEPPSGIPKITTATPTATTTATATEVPKTPTSTSTATLTSTATPKAATPTTTEVPKTPTATIIAQETSVPEATEVTSSNPQSWSERSQFLQSYWPWGVAILGVGLLVLSFILLQNRKMP